MLEETESLNYSSTSAEGSRHSDDSTSTPELDENYYAEDMSSLNTVPDLENAIEQIKALVLQTRAVTDERHKLVKRLIELRLKLQDLKDFTDEQELDTAASAEELRTVQSHHFVLQKQYIHRTPQYCDRCNGVVWTVLQNYFRCKGCNYQCHSKCLNQVVRTCQSLNVSVDTEYIRNICPEKGIAFQNFKCVECSVHFTLKNSWMEPRRCDYDGRYYCPICHKNSTSTIPARIIRNWDFEERRVCEASKQFLSLMSRKPNINLEALNPKLFGFVEELNAVKRLREEITVMKGYLMTCREASSHRLLRLLEERQHFVENSFMYSLQDLIDVENGTLIKYLTSVHAQFLKHIREECQICQGKGYICEICENIEPIFPFDAGTHQCQQCNAVYHNICFSKRESCPKCIRRSKRRESSTSSVVGTG